MMVWRTRSRSSFNPSIRYTDKKFKKNRNVLKTGFGPKKHRILPFKKSLNSFLYSICDDNICEYIYVIFLLCHNIFLYQILGENEELRYLRSGSSNPVVETDTGHDLAGGIKNSKYFNHLENSFMAEKIHDSIRFHHGLRNLTKMSTF